MLLSAVSVLVVAQSSSEIPEGLMNNPVYRSILLNGHTHPFTLGPFRGWQVLLAVHAPEFNALRFISFYLPYLMAVARHGLRCDLLYYLLKKGIGLCSFMRLCEVMV